MTRTAAPLLLATLAACGVPSADASGAASDSEPRFPPAWEFQRGDVAPSTTERGMVVSTDRVASEIGAEILRRNGNAVDAAVAVHFALAVVNPEAGNIGGGGFLVARMADGTTAALDFRETAPAAATRDMYLRPDGSVHPTRSLVGHLSVAVPGSVAGMWEAHRRFGSLPWAELLAPAIALAEGFVVHERLAASLRTYEPRFSTFPATAAAFLPLGRPPRVGERWVQGDLAATLRRIAAEGADGFYRGRTAELVEAEMRRGGGILTAADLAAYRAVWREPVRFTYRGHPVISMPPPSSGGATVGAILKILEGYDLRSMGYLSPGHVHLFAEAARRAYADRNAYLADPDFVPQPVERMLSEAYAAERRRTISPDRATPSAGVRPGMGPPPAEGESTTHYSIVDARGNVVAVTTTLNSLYGSRVVAAGTGFLLNNEMDDFTSRPGVPNQFGLVQGAANAIRPGKRMLSAMTPTILLDPAGRPLLVTGSPGGATIITSVAGIIVNVVDFGMDAPLATIAPRVHHQHLPDTLRFERRGLPAATVRGLRAMGHALAEREGFQGDAQTIVLLPGGRQSAVADPRKGGAAVPVAEPHRVVH
jgi:gamma-glutamyltranspeptidase / glutathione hydrolase